eukprot:6054690-Pleurochrysis_carterae.AAC.1
MFDLVRSRSRICGFAVSKYTWSYVELIGYERTMAASQRNPATRIAAAQRMSTPRPCCRPH